MASLQLRQAKKNTVTQICAALTVGFLLFTAFANLASGADLSAQDKQFLAHYEEVRAALAADNLADAKKAATTLGEEGKAIAESETIAAAREAFADVSTHAISLAKGRPDYYVVRCPMLKKEWVQNATAISNPYAGKSMLTCGIIKK